MEGLLLIIFLIGSFIMLKVGLRLVSGSPKKRLQQKVDLGNYEIYEKEIKKLNQFKEEKNIKEIINYLDYSGDDDFGIRDHAADLLGELRDPSAVQPLVSALKGKSFKSFLLALKEIGKPSVEPLTDTLSNKNLSTNERKEIIKILGQLKQFYPINTLISLLNDEDRGIKKNALKALNEITGESFGYEEENWQEWCEKNK